jgi:hypothetical protein
LLLTALKYFEILGGMRIPPGKTESRNAEMLKRERRRGNAKIGKTAQNSKRRDQSDC